MEKKYRLEPFNLERAKAGEPVCTVNGEDVKLLCFERNKVVYPIVALIGYNESVMTYTRNGKTHKNGESNSDLMMKVEVKESYAYADVAGEIRPFEELKAEGFVDLKSLDYLIIKTYDGKFLKIWKKNLHTEEWKDAQVAAANTIGMGWRCPTRHECIYIYDVRFRGLDDAMKEIGGDSLRKVYWTSEADSDPQYSADRAVYFNGSTGGLYGNIKCTQYSVRPVCEKNN